MECNASFQPYRWLFHSPFRSFARMNTHEVSRRFVKRHVLKWLDVGGWEELPANLLPIRAGFRMIWCGNQIFLDQVFTPKIGENSPTFTIICFEMGWLSTHQLVDDLDVQVERLIYNVEAVGHFMMLLVWFTSICHRLLWVYKVYSSWAAKVLGKEQWCNKLLIPLCISPLVFCRSSHSSGYQVFWCIQQSQFVMAESGNR